MDKKKKTADVTPKLGRVLMCRPIGVIEGEEGAGKKKERNDRIIAVEQDAHSWADIKTQLMI